MTGTAVDTSERVLQCALGLATKNGFSGVSIAAITDACGVSNGSIYHHFGSKEGVLVALTLNIVESYQQAVIGALERNRDNAYQGVMDAVAAHLTWSERHRTESRLLIDNRESVARGSGKEQIREQNLRFGDRTMQWMSLQATKGDLPPVTIEIAHAIVFAPAEEICRRWLLGRQKAPSTFATALGNAAWAGLISLGRGNMQ